MRKLRFESARGRPARTCPPLQRNWPPKKKRFLVKHLDSHELNYRFCSFNILFDRRCSTFDYVAMLNGMLNGAMSLIKREIIEAKRNLYLLCFHSTKVTIILFFKTFFFSERRQLSVVCKLIPEISHVPDLFRILQCNSSTLPRDNSNQPLEPANWVASYRESPKKPLGFAHSLKNCRLGRWTFVFKMFAFSDPVINAWMLLIQKLVNKILKKENKTKNESI